MIKVVIDTSVLISGVLSEHGAPAAVLALIRDGGITWYVSPAIIEEYKEVMARSKFSFDPGRLQRVLRSLDHAALVVPTETRTESSHESDNRFYECAYAAQADYIVTGNLKHFTKDLPPTRIVNARQLLEILEPKSES
jgi:putative PIN family toxin of toxin-antitoxin system